jgi:predicted ATPase
MYFIRNVSVEKFWESYDFNFELNRDCTFFIGQNGTGKTTLINLIAAVLTADVRMLHKIPFKRVVIDFADRPRGNTPRLTVTKAFSKKAADVETLEYRIQNIEAGAKEIKFSMDEGMDEYLLRRYRYEEMPAEYFRRMRNGLLPSLRRMYEVNWLSINRINQSVLPRDEKQFESTIDRKIDSLVSDLGRYLATLSKRKDEEVRLFQESIFMSLLEVNESVAPIDMRISSDIEGYEKILQTIFSELHVSEKNSAPVITSFIDRARSLDTSYFVSTPAKRFKSAYSSQDDAIFAAGFTKIERIVKRWDELQDKLNIIFAQRNKFLTIVNSLLQRKSMEVTETNELQFVSRTGKPLTPYMLSSGEKQLIILLSETLLQREETTIYIADEPELSLHVLWQEKLIGSISALNPNAQLIIATHSPDIVGYLENKAIDMESLIQ